MGVYPEDTRDSYKHGIFNGFSLNVLFWGTSRPGTYWTHALYPSGAACCSSKMVSFAVSEPSKMHTIYYVLYNLFVYKNGTYGNKAAPTNLPEQEVFIG